MMVFAKNYLLMMIMMVVVVVVMVMVLTGLHIQREREREREFTYSFSQYPHLISTQKIEISIDSLFSVSWLTYRNSIF